MPGLARETDLEGAWSRRTELGLFERFGALRIFHGESYAVDRFGVHYWVTDWSGDPSVRPHVLGFLEAKGAASVAWLHRPESGIPEVAQIVLGQFPESGFPVLESSVGCPARYWIRFHGVRHPGLFLDHRPVREWLYENLRGRTVLNTFAYTGSLSVAAGLGGAAHVTTLDLSKTTVDWARENWRLNGLSEDRADWIFGDVFDWLPRMRKRGRKFDCVILDPPSFSRGKSGVFSTAKDLVRLHTLALELIERNGCLVTSINSATIPLSQFESEVNEAAHRVGVELALLHRIELPRETFPEQPGYLKGGIYRLQ